MHKLLFFALSIAIVLSIGGPLSAKQERDRHRKDQRSEHFFDFMEDLGEFSKRTENFTEGEWNFILGYAAYREGQWLTARKYLDRVNGKEMLVGDHLLYYRAVAASEIGNHQEAKQLIDQLRLEYPLSVWMQDGRRIATLALIELHRHDEARELLKEYRRGIDSPQELRDADLILVRSSIDAGEGAEAAEQLRRMALAAASEEEYADIAPLIATVDMRFDSHLAAWLDEPQQQYLIARSFESRSQWDDAIARLDRLLAHPHLPPSLRAEAMWLLGNCHSRVHHYQRAIDILEEVRGMPESRGFQSEILSRLATTYAKLDRYDDAIAIRKNMIVEGRSHPQLVRRIAYRVAYLYVDQGRYREAIDEFHKVMALKGSREFMTNVRWQIGWCYWKLGEFTAAITQFDALLKTTSKKSPTYDRIVYWKARALEKMGRGEARAMYRQLNGERRIGYYRELARRRLEGDLRDGERFVFVTWGGGKGSQWVPNLPHERQVVGQSLHFARALSLHRMGLHEEVARELSAIERNANVQSDIVLYLAAKNRAHHRAYAIALGRSRGLEMSLPGGEGFERFVWEQLYPQAYQSYVENALGVSDLDPRLVYAIMRAESNFRPRVVSPAGAIGLMQLMPTTARKLAYDMDEKKFDSRELFTPSINIKYGIQYLHKLEKLFPRNPVAWIAAYNAGEEAVERWLLHRPTMDLEEFIEEIPYEETNLYVKKVLTAYWAGQILYPR